MKRILASITLAIFSTSVFSAPEEFSMGKFFGYPACNEHFDDKGCRVGAWSSIPPHRGSYVNPSSAREVKTSQNIFVLPRHTDYVDTAFIDEYFKSQKAMALLVLKDGKIIYENYQYGRKPDMVFRGFSMSKTVVGMLVGIAHEKGHIKSLDDTAEMYYQEIAGTAYGGTTIRNLLRMRSGIEFDELSLTGPMPDRRRWWRSMNNAHYKGPNALVELARYFNKRPYPQGTKFNYSEMDTEILSRVVIKATGMNLSELTEKWIWRPIGAEGSAYWMVYDSDNLEHSPGGFHARLRDWGRFALMLSNNGRVGDRQIINEKYVEEATSLINQHRQLHSNGRHYGYQTWIFPGSQNKRVFAMSGSFGQSIFVQPSSAIIMVQLSVYDTETKDPRYSVPKHEFVNTLFKMFGGGF